ncbi:MAG: rod shape-determining protein MreD [Bacteroidetes bacterium]|nr:MAG: rod shape-determining protein MreD [Bacteroidota bacterium]
MFIMLLLLQTVVIDPINLGAYATPVLYVLFIMLWPTNVKPWVTLVVCFAAGQIADIFSATGGIHSFTMVLTALVRYYIQPLFVSKDEAEKAYEPNLFNLGYRLFFFYALSLTLTYHIVFSFLEKFSFHYFFSTLATAIISTLLSVVMIFLIQLLFYRIRPEEV